MGRKVYDIYEPSTTTRSSSKRGGGKKSGNDVLILVLLTLFFIVTVAGSIVYYNTYRASNISQEVKAETTATTVQTDAVEQERLPTKTPDEQRDEELQAFVEDIELTEEESKVAAMAEFLERMENAELTYPITMTSYQEPTLKVHTLVFLLSFKNQSLASNTALWQDYYYGDGYYDTGSVYEYYREVSRGRIAIVPVKETQGTKNDGLISINMNENHPRFTGAFYFSSNQDKVSTAIFDYMKRVLTKGNQYVDYSKYDADGDGLITSSELNIVMIFAGYEDAMAGGAIGNTTYSARMRYPEDETINLDGVKINTAIFTSELDPTLDKEIPIVPMGIVCHEIGHNLLLPDLYDTDYSSEGLAFHSLMAAGSYNYYGGEMGSLPPPLMAWSLTKLGVQEPITITDSGTYRLWARSNENYNIIKIPTANGYYLLENVDFEGYGQGLAMYAKSPGIAIWYIDEQVINSLTYQYTMAANDNEFRPGVRLVEPFDGTELLDENFSYVTVHDHYFRLSGDSNYIGAHGVIIDILDDPSEEMTVKIKIN